MTEEEPDEGTVGGGATKRATTKRAGSKRKSKRKTKSRSKRKTSKRGATRKRRPKLPYPSTTFQSSLALPKAIFEHGGGLSTVNRLTVFDFLDASADSGPSRMLISHSYRYGLTTGNYKSEDLTLTPEGEVVVDPEADPALALRTKVQLAIKNIEPFGELYDELVGNRVPSEQILKDKVGKLGIPSDYAEECVAIFLENLRFVGLVRELSGKERIIPVDLAASDLPTADGTQGVDTPELGLDPLHDEEGLRADVPYDQVCFFIAPIGKDGAIDRSHSDMVLETLITPALKELGLTVIRADKITKPGIINAQVIRYILKSKLVIVDMSFHNPNVFYELCLRHATGLPTVHIIQTSDKIPFDLGSFRTVLINTEDKYALARSVDTKRAEIRTFAERALAEGKSKNNPILAFNPGISLSVP